MMKAQAILAVLCALYCSTLVEGSALRGPAWGYLGYGPVGVAARGYDYGNNYGYDKIGGVGPAGAAGKGYDNAYKNTGYDKAAGFGNVGAVGKGYDGGYDDVYANSIFNGKTGPVERRGAGYGQYPGYGGAGFYGLLADAYKWKEPEYYH